MVVVASAVERFGLVLALVPLLLLGRMVRLLGDRETVTRRRSARGALVAAAVGASLLVGWSTAAVIIALSPVGGTRSWPAALLLAGPVLGALRYTVPALLAAARSTPTDLAATRVALPARLLPVAAGAGAAGTVLAQPSTRTFGVLVLVLVAGVISLDATQRARRAAGLPPTLRWPARSRLVVPLILVLAATGCGLAGATTSAIPAELVAAGHTAHLESARLAVRDIADLTGAPPVGPVTSTVLVADEATVPLESGAAVDAWTFGGTLPGTELRVREGDDVEVRLVNRLDTASTTIHWHGLEVPNAMDGVAGVTQDAVPPGGEFTYRFRAERPGTFWHHAHQTSSEQVGRGLFGALVVEPRGGLPSDVDETVLVHDWATDRGDRLAFGTADGVDLRQAAPGSTVRLRVVNTDSFSTRVSVTGSPFRLAALDGRDLHDPGELTTEQIDVGGGGRADVEFRMPDGPVRLSVAGSSDVALVLSPDGATTVDAAPSGAILDVTGYGRPTATPFGRGDRFDRDLELRIDEGLGFFGGGPDYLYTINGEVYPNATPLRVAEGDLVRVRIVNGGLSEHPMHLHGHHVLVLSRDGRAVTGSPVWLDTVLVRPGEVWEVAFRADNPGIWMDHCHILFHAAAGMVLHLHYDGVGSRFDAGSASGNVPE